MNDPLPLDQALVHVEWLELKSEGDMHLLLPKLWGSLLLFLEFELDFDLEGNAHLLLTSTFPHN